MKISSVYYIIFLFIVTQTAFSQDNQFLYKRKIMEIEKEGWYSIKLPDAIFDRLNDRFSNIRILRISEKDTVEIPYILHTANDVVTHESVDLNIINKSNKGNIQYFTLALHEAQKVNSLDVIFKQKNFNALIKIEGSHDQQVWFEIADRQRILSIQNEFVDYSFSSVNFSTSAYKYLRITTTPDVPLDIEKISLKNQSISKGVENKITSKWKVIEDKNTRQTIVNVLLDHYVPVSKLNLDISHDDDFYRDFSIDYVTDSSLSPKGWIKFYSTISENYVTSINPNTFVFPQVVGKAFRLVIHNHDNRPLKFNAVEFIGPQVMLKAKLQHGDNYLFYGNPTLGSPSYDLSHFNKSIPDSMPMLSIGIEERVAASIEKTNALFDSKVWLWGIMAVLIIVLGFFTLRMMKNPN